MMGKDRRLGLLGTVCLFATGCFSYGPYGHPGTFAPPNTAMASPLMGSHKSRRVRSGFLPVQSVRAR